MTKRPIWLADLFLFAAQLCLAQQPAPVMVEQGLVQGASEDGLTVYRGIPFAAPPVGDLRWRAPQPAAKWEGIRQTTRFGLANQRSSFITSTSTRSIRKARPGPATEQLG